VVEQPTHRWIEHTAELELELEAADEAAVFEEAMVALLELWEEHGGLEGAGGPAHTREVALEAPERTALLADWIEELAFVGETKGMIPTRLSRFELHETGLTAAIEGPEGRTPPIVKAVTYHRLEFARDGDRWRARAVLDV
jgi:protein archease